MTLSIQLNPDLHTFSFCLNVHQLSKKEILQILRLYKEVIENEWTYHSCRIDDPWQSSYKTFIKIESHGLLNRLELLNSKNRNNVEDPIEIQQATKLNDRIQKIEI